MGVYNYPMPTLTRWFVRTSFIYLFFGLAVGILLALGQVNLLSSFSTGMFPVYIHLLVFGWLTQLIFGIALWMFPKYSREQPRGNEGLSWATYVLLNVGLLLRVVGEPLNAANAHNLFADWLLVISALLQWAAAIGFVLNVWPRVKER